MIRTIAFLGIGIMGAPMARNLARAGFQVRAWNRTAEKARALADDGIEPYEDAGEAVRDADCVALMMLDGPSVAETLFERGVADIVPAGSIVIDFSSAPPDLARDHAARLAERGVGHLDAPVSGGPSGAEAATLAIMVGGESETFEVARPVLEALGRPTHVGGPGAGQVAKLSNQVIVGVTIGAVAEALLLAEAAGADPAKVREAMMGGFADSQILRIHGQRMIDRTFVPGAACTVHQKDMRTIIDAASKGGAFLPLSEVVRNAYDSIVARGGGGYDHSALLLELEHLNEGVRLGGDKPDTLPD